MLYIYIHVCVIFKVVNSVALTYSSNLFIWYRIFCTFILHNRNGSMRKLVRSLLLSSLTMNECMLCTAQGAKIKYYDTMRPYEKLVYKKCYKVQTIECSHICDQQNVTIVLIMYWLSDWSHTYMTTFNGLHFVAYFSYGLIVS